MGVVLHEGYKLDEVFSRADRISALAPDLGYLMLDGFQRDGFAVVDGGPKAAATFNEFHEAAFGYAELPLEIRDSAKPIGGRGYASASAVAVPELRFDLNDNFLRPKNAPVPIEEETHPTVMRLYQASEGARVEFKHDADAFYEALYKEYDLPVFPRFEDIQDNMTRLPDAEELERFNERRKKAHLSEMTLEDIRNVPYTVVKHDDGTIISAGTLPLIADGHEGVEPALEVQIEGKPHLYAPVRGLKPGERLWYPGRCAVTLTKDELSPTYHRVLNRRRDRSSILYFDSVDHTKVLRRRAPAIRNILGWHRVRTAARVGRNIEKEFLYVPA